MRRLIPLLLAGLVAFPSVALAPAAFVIAVQLKSSGHYSVSETIADRNRQKRPKRRKRTEVRKPTKPHAIVKQAVKPRYRPEVFWSTSFWVAPEATKRANQN